MSQTPSIVFESPFQAPIVRAQFDVLLVLAECMAPSLPALSAVAANWQRVVTVAAEALASQSPHVKSIAHAVPIWNRVLLDLGINSLTPGAKSVLGTITERLATEVATPFTGEQRLQKMRGDAVTWIRELGTRREISVLRQAVVYPIRVHYNPDGNDYCASSGLFAGEIGWNLQLVDRALYGALILDMLFEHEYPYIEHTGFPPFAIQCPYRDIALPLGHQFAQQCFLDKSLITTEARRQINEQITTKRMRFYDMRAP